MISGLSMRRRVVGDIVGDLSSWLFGGGIIKNGTFRKIEKFRISDNSKLVSLKR